MNNAELPADWKVLLRQCNFQLARRELEGLFKITDEEAAVSEEQAVYRKDFVRAWQRFADSPHFDTAVDLIDVAPPLFRYFFECCPGGRLAFYDSMLGERGGE